MATTFLHSDDKQQAEEAHTDILKGFFFNCMLPLKQTLWFSLFCVFVCIYKNR